MVMLTELTQYSLGLDSSCAQLPHVKYMNINLKDAKSILTEIESVVKEDKTNKDKLKHAIKNLSSDTGSIAIRRWADVVGFSLKVSIDHKIEIEFKGEDKKAIDKLLSTGKLHQIVLDSLKSGIKKKYKDPLTGERVSYTALPRVYHYLDNALNCLKEETKKR